MISLGTLESTSVLTVHQLPRDVACPPQSCIVIVLFVSQEALRKFIFPSFTGAQTQAWIPEAPESQLSAGSPLLSTCNSMVNLLFTCAWLGAQSPAQCPGYMIRYCHTVWTSTGHGKQDGDKKEAQESLRQDSKMVINKHCITNQGFITKKTHKQPFLPTARFEERKATRIMKYVRRGKIFHKYKHKNHVI